MAYVGGADFAIVVIGVHYPCKRQLLQIAKTGRTLALLPGPLQCGHQYRHQYRDNGNYHQKFY